MKSAEAIKEMKKALLCLHLELPESVINDVERIWDNLKHALTEREKEIRNDQRKKCWDAVEAQKKCDATGWPIAMDVYAHKQAILNAGKETK